MERIEEIVANKQLRKEIDEKIQQVKALPASSERSLAITKLQEAVMWIATIIFLMEYLLAIIERESAVIE